MPLSIAQVDPSVLEEPAAAGTGPAADGALGQSVLHEHLLAAVVTRAGELEAVAWELDQAKAACDAQVAAAVSAGVPAERVAAAAGTTVSALVGLAGQQLPAN
jgi:predicted metal-dependent phosphotriesterase family hydrolase